MSITHDIDNTVIEISDKRDRQMYIIIQENIIILQ